MNNFKTLEQLYLDMAEEYEKKGDRFSAAYYRRRAFEVSCYE